ncbi:MAG TPA: CarD family transcriptional regulator, partial [Bacteroides graminisolvens]|nr:CarD family transcriptional regulator [Bacteroides graminisolvens]
MTITELQQQYAAHPHTDAVNKLLNDTSVKHLFCGGLCASAASFFSSSLIRKYDVPFVFILGDLEEAGYFYHDLTQILGTERVLFFPSSFRRAIKYGQKDAANEILRTEALSRLEKGDTSVCIVTYPDALSEKVVSRNNLKEKSLKLHTGERVDTSFITDVLHSYGFEYVDYVYEPGQYAVRGSIIDVFSFSSEFPYRIDFFGDEVESIRTFEVESQLSIEKKKNIVIVPDLGLGDGSDTSFLDFIPQNTVLAVKDFLWLRERMQVIYEEAVAPQALIAQEEGSAPMRLENKLIDGSEFVTRALDFRRLEFGSKPTGTPDASLQFAVTPQPVFHKNFDLVAASFKEYQEKGYTLYICSDSNKQTERIRSIFEDRGDHISFVPVERTLHEGFADNQLRICVFTDHQLFDRYHKYNLKSDKARSGKVALSLKELNQFTPGDYVVHTDHGVGRFAGLVRIPNGDTTQEVIKIVYQNEDVVFVSIHSLHKVSKYKGKEGEPPRLNKLGTGAWEKLKERTKSKIKDIARDLIKLYSQRREEKGFAFSPDSFLQRELEASFIYEDTPDQSKATADVKQDME